MIIVLAEGSGEEKSIPTLIKRKNRTLSIKCISLGGKSNVIRKKDGDGFEATVRRLVGIGHHQFFVLLDDDVTFEPYKTLAEEKDGMRQRAHKISTELNIKVVVLYATKMYESWLIGGLEGSKTFCGLKSHRRKVRDNTEVWPTKPKEWIEGNLEDVDYSPGIQKCLTEKFNLASARKRNPSLKTFFKHF